MYRNEEEKFIRIGELIAKKIQGIPLSSTEENQLEQWLSHSHKNQETYERCIDNHVQTESYAYLSSVDVSEAFTRFQKNRLAGLGPRNAHRLRRIAPYLVAAGVLIAAAFSVYTLYFGRYNAGAEKQKSGSIDYAPAANKATVTLSDGRVFDLDQVQNEIYIDDGGVNYSDGTRVAETGSVASIKIATPRGGLYNVTLPDGTHVRLNAASELTYPTVFKKDSRDVQLRGEAYFEVARQSGRPFTVRTSDQLITVLGTHFNVEAYDASSPTKTTLAEGKVRVLASSTQTEVMLQPGQQAVLREGRLSTKSIDVQQELAWIYGKFNFDGKTLKEVMNELSRWYDVDVVYDGPAPDIYFFGGTFRSSKLSTILSVLQNHNIQYRLTDDNRLIISSTE